MVGSTLKETTDAVLNFVSQAEVAHNQGVSGQRLKLETRLPVAGERTVGW